MHFISLGCPRNRVDTEVMLGLLLQAGYEVAPTIEEADYTIINTCGFLEAAREESLATIGEVIAKKKKQAKVIVAGCMVQSHRAKIEQHHPEIDYFLGSGDVESVVDAIQARERGSKVTSAQSYLQAGEVPRRLSTPSHYAYLKIAEGCKKQCAYCIIPAIKGKLKSKPIERIVAEFRLLLDQGVKEVILIAQDLGDWGKDIGYRRSQGLVAVLQALLEDKREFWLRLLYLYPDEITPNLIALIKSDPRICRYLDMPIQHINNRLLKAMYRKTTKEQICQVITNLRDSLPDISIRTSLIVGFPGETEREFQELSHFVRTYALDEVGIFQYSREPGSAAFSLQGHLDDEVKAKRQKKLFEVQQRGLKKKLRRKVGQILRVLVEGYHPDSPLLLRGRHQGQCPDIDSEVILNCAEHVDAFGQWYPVLITEVAGPDLIGHVINDSPPAAL
ncbi:MAG: 30S ribosomal protein S12 methylthiotransferase RimO [Chlamydiota bacterium]